jgi:hypothetical protein
MAVVSGVLKMKKLAEMVAEFVSKVGQSHSSCSRPECESRPGDTYHTFIQIPCFKFHSQQVELKSP